MTDPTLAAALTLTSQLGSMLRALAGRTAPTDAVCPRCAERKPMEAFGLRANGKLQSWCKACRVEHNRAARLASKVAP